MRFLLSLLMCFAIAACGHSNGADETAPPPPASDTPQPGPTPTPTPPPKDPETYFRQFLFKLLSGCGKQLAIYRYADTEAVAIAVNDKGQAVLAEVSLLLYADHTYKVAYQEVDVVEYIPDGYISTNPRTRFIFGFWRVNGNRLELSGLGSAVAGLDQKSPTMRLTVNYDIITPGLKANAMLMHNVDSTFVPVPDADPCVTSQSMTTSEPKTD